MSEFDIDSAVLQVSRAAEHSRGDVHAIAAAARTQIQMALEHGRGSRTTETLVGMLRQRDAHGKKKYGTSLDRTDLNTVAWLRHLIEEMLDGAGYALRSIDKIEGRE